MVTQPKNPPELSENDQAALDKKEAALWPEGFDSYDLSYDNYEAWDWDKNPMLVGVVTQVKNINLMRKGKATDVYMVVVKVGDDEFALWETAQLKPLMEKTFSGQEVAIKFTGMEDIKGGKRIRTFEARVRGI